MGQFQTIFFFYFNTIHKYKSYTESVLSFETLPTQCNVIKAMTYIHYPLRLLKYK